MEMELTVFPINTKQSTRVSLWIFLQNDKFCCSILDFPSIKETLTQHFFFCAIDFSYKFFVLFVLNNKHPSCYLLQIQTNTTVFLLFFLLFFLSLLHSKNQSENKKIFGCKNNVADPNISVLNSFITNVMNYYRTSSLMITNEKLFFGVIYKCLKSLLA